MGRSESHRLLGLSRGSVIVEGFGSDDQSVIFASAGKVALIVAVKRVAASRPKLFANPD
jgi:hypothetical protein